MPHISVHAGDIRESEAAINDEAIANYCRFYGLAERSASIAQIRDSSAGVNGWAGY